MEHIQTEKHRERQVRAVKKKEQTMGIHSLESIKGETGQGNKRKQVRGSLAS
jgi:hypothetical protein